MNTQKKSLFALAMTMTLSIAVIQGISKSHVVAKDRNLQQLSLGAGYLAGQSEGGTQGVLYATAGLLGNAAVTIGYGALTNGWNPLGWVGGAVAIGTGL